MQVSGKDTTKRVDCEPKRVCLNAEKRRCFVQFAVAAWARVCVGTPQRRTGADQRGNPTPQGLKIWVCSPLDRVSSSARDFFPTEKRGFTRTAAIIQRPLCVAFGRLYLAPGPSKWVLLRGLETEGEARQNRELARMRKFTPMQRHTPAPIGAGEHGELTAGRGASSTRKRNFFGGKNRGSFSHYARAGASGTRVRIAEETPARHTRLRSWQRSPVPRGGDCVQLGHQVQAEIPPRGDRDGKRLVHFGKRLRICLFLFLHSFPDFAGCRFSLLHYVC